MIALGEQVRSGGRIFPQLIRYPAIDPVSFETAVLQFCDYNA